MQDDDLFAARAALARLALVQSQSNVAATDKRILNAVNRLLEVRWLPEALLTDRNLDHVP